MESADGWKEVKDMGSFERHPILEKVVGGKATRHELLFLDDGKKLTTPSGESFLFLVKQLKCSNGSEIDVDPGKTQETWISMRNPLLKELKGMLPLQNKTVTIEWEGKGKNQRAKII